MALKAHLIVPALATLILAVASGRPTRGAAPEARDRSPIDLALSPDGRYALTANADSDTVSLVDISAGRLLSETPVGMKPFCVAWSRDGRRAVVSERDSNAISLLDVTPDRVSVMRTLPVGEEPRGVALSPDAATAYVALSGDDAVAVVDLAASRVTARLPVGADPWHLALTPDGRRLAVGCAESMELDVIDLPTRQLDQVVSLPGRNLRHVALSPDGRWAYVCHIFQRGRPTVKADIARGWVIGNRLSRCPLGAKGDAETMALDPPAEATGDIDGVAVRPDGGLIALTAGGSHELLLLRGPMPFEAAARHSDLIEPELRAHPDRFQRIPLGGRPLGLAFTPDGRDVVTANSLLDALQVVDVDTGRLVRSIPLGGPSAPSLARRGEAIFMDAERSFQHWYSCNTCHVEGDTGDGIFDTFNDDSYGTPKKTPGLRGVTQTGPWTWHGSRPDLRHLLRDSLTHTEQGPEPAPQDLDALIAYLDTLKFRPNPHRAPDGALTVEAQRGAAVFQSSGCVTCHAPPLYTTPGIYDVGLGSPDDVHQGFNPPSLHGLYRHAPYLHRGQAQTLRDLLTVYHRASKLSGKPDPQGAALDDLIAFLRSL